MSWERARKPEQVAIRREAILIAARSLFASHSYDEVSFNGIARKAGFSKPNLYRYFSSLEEIFLTITMESQERFFNDLISRIKRSRSKDTISSIVGIWVETSLNHTDFLDLLPQISLSLESNSSLEQIITYKKQSLRNIAELTAVLKQKHSDFDENQWGNFLHNAAALMIGLWPMSNPSEKVREAMNHPEVNYPCIDFKSALEHGLTSLLLGEVQRSNAQNKD